MDTIELKSKFSFFAVKNNKGAWLNKSASTSKPAISKEHFSWSPEVNTAKVFGSKGAASRLKTTYLKLFPESSDVKIVEFIASQARVIEE